MKTWWKRQFCVISNKAAVELGLHHVENIYGDLINHINCRSIWADDTNRLYRVESLVYDK